MKENEITGPVTLEKLNKVKYQNLHSVLKQLGVERAWKGGGKKVDIINRALQLVSVLEAAKREGKVSPEELDKALIEAEEQRENALKQIEIKEQEAKEAKEEEAKESVKKLDLTKDQIKQNLETIDKNLIGATALHREILIPKQRALLEKLAEMEAEEEQVVIKGGSDEE